MKKFLKVSGYIFLALIMLLGAAFFKFNEKQPIGKTGEKAEALAQKMLQAVNKPAWDSIGVISWASRVGNKHLWDKKRGLAQVEWKNNKVLLDIDKKTGKAWENQTPVSDPKKSNKLVQDAYKMFVNDMFWLNPVVKIFDDGTERSIVTLPDGTEGLMVAYKSGGVTPGDSYLWLLDANGLPKAWKLWVKVIPIGGVEISWDNWVTLPSGAKVSTMYKAKGMSMEIPTLNIKSAKDLAVYGLSDDPFLPILLNHD